MITVNYVIVLVSDMARSVAFYRDVLGLPLRFESPGWTEFSTGGATVALHATDEPATGEDPRHLAAGRCRFGFAVPDLDAFHQRMIEHAVPCVTQPEVVFGARVALYTGPDGIGISVSQARG